jgi:hypothetical protein
MYGSMHVRMLCCAAQGTEMDSNAEASMLMIFLGSVAY